MPCGCRKKVSKVQESRLAVQFDIISRRMANKDPSKLHKKILMDYHKKTHMLYAAAIKRKPPNKKFINSIVTLHDNLAKEMIRRGIDHKSPLESI
jgi:hypothetical protein